MASVDLRRQLPSVEQVLQRPEVRRLLEHYGRTPLLQHLRHLLEDIRGLAAAGDETALDRALDELDTDLAMRLGLAARPSLVRVINATGVVIHTNLGRAPLARHVLQRVAETAAGYSNLEFDLASGRRGRREVHAEQRLRTMLETEAVVVVNNNAAAVLLAVNTLAEGREVLVSRGELVEIGGSFRIPDVLRKGGAHLKEVGTTNRTRLTDFKEALSEDTALILRVHPSNFRVLGFTESPSRQALAGLAHETGLPLVEDLGSGALSGLPPELRKEPDVSASLKAGVDIVTFSGDKLLGGPQAGILAGRQELAHKLRANPLYRALRVDKMTLAALDAVLEDHQTERAAEQVPALRMLGLTPKKLQARARQFVDRLQAAAPDRCAACEVSLAVGESTVGGGAAPGVALATTLVTLRHPRRSAEELAAGLRAGHPPVVTRVARESVVIDLRTVHPDDEDALAQAVLQQLEEPAPP